MTPEDDKTQDGADAPADEDAQGQDQSSDGADDASNSNDQDPDGNLKTDDETESENDSSDSDESGEGEDSGPDDPQFSLNQLQQAVREGSQAVLNAASDLAARHPAHSGKSAAQHGTDIAARIRDLIKGF